LITLEVEESEYPMAMSTIGTWSGFDGAQHTPLFLPGDILTRHSTKTEKANSEDLRRWIESAKQSERDKITERLTTYVNLPEGTTLQAISPSGLPIDSPMRLIESAQYRRERDPDHLLSGEDLIWIFRQRASLDLEEIGTDVLIASALRRSATLFWWVAESHRQTILDQVMATFDASDRDKSDAAASIIELAALFASDDELDRILELLENSRYAHFIETAQSWQGRDPELQEIRNRIVSSTHENINLVDMSISDLESLASSVAEYLSEQSSAALSRKLGTITRVVWAKKSDRGNELLA
jgi:hypothetical protein